jgi:hypothetical protein
VINRETSVKASVAQELVERDLDFPSNPLFSNILTLLACLFAFAVINRETSVKASVAQELVERDLDFLPPPSREEGAGRYYVPMMRISVIQHSSWPAHSATS